MAGEVTYSGQVTNGGRVVHYLSQLLHETLYDPSDLRRLMSFVDYDGLLGSDTTRVTTVDSPGAAAAATSEVVGGAANVALVTGNYDLQVARFIMRMEPTDLFGLITTGPLDPEYIVSKLVEAVGLTMTNLLVALFANVSGSVGATTTALSVDDFYDAAFALNLVNNVADYAAVLHPNQVNHLRESVRGETGAAPERADVQAALDVPGRPDKGSGFMFRYAEVDVFQSDSVVEVTSTHYRGAMFSQGAFSYTMGAVNRQPNAIMLNPNDIILMTPELFIERSRDAANGLSPLFLNFYPATAEQEDARATQLISKSSA